MNSLSSDGTHLSSKLQHLPSSRNRYLVLIEDEDENENLFEYQALPVDSPYIRLLHLQPATSPSEPLKGYLDVVSLNSKPEYRALSYVWVRHIDSVLGPAIESEVTRDHDAPPAEITLSGRQLTIGGNLFTALTRVRRDIEVLRIWIDAICINQDDIEERNAQVKLMTRIYSNAEEVLVCFDDDAGMARAYQGVFPAIKADAHYWRQRMLTRTNTQKALERPTTDEEWLSRFWQDHWWRRAWTAQEFMLAKKVRFYFYSAVSLTCADLMDLITYIEKYDEQVVRNEESNLCYGRSLGLYTHTVFTEPLTFGQRVKTVLLLRSGIATQLQRPSAVELVAASRYREAGDSKDKVFAFLGLHPELLNQVDYRNSVQTCYETFAISTITSSETLDILDHIIGVPNQYWKASLPAEMKSTWHYEPLRLPSWVPDWTLRLDRWDHDAMNTKRKQLHFQQAASKVKSHVKHLGYGKILIRGRFCGIVTAIGKQCLYGGFAASFRECFQDWSALVATLTTQSPQDSGVSLQASLMRCLTRGFSWQWIRYFIEDLHHQPTGTQPEALDIQLHDIFIKLFTASPGESKVKRDELGTTYIEVQNTDDRAAGVHLDELSDTTDSESSDMAFAARLDPLQTIPSKLRVEMDTFSDFVLHNVVLERLIADNKGRLGFAPATAEIGDIIVVFAGAKSPSVLRRNKQKKSKKHKKQSQLAHYVLLGPAYVDGLMNGEALLLDAEDFVLV